MLYLALTILIWGLAIALIKAPVAVCFIFLVVALPVACFYALGWAFASIVFGCRALCRFLMRFGRPPQTP